MPCNSETCLLEFDVLVQYFHKILVNMQKFNTAPLWNGFIYLWTLLHGVTGSKNNEYTWHFETEISGSKNQEISWSDKEFPIEDKILTAMLVKREVSNVSYPRRYGSSAVNSLSKKPPTQNSQSVSLYDIICHFLHLLHSTWGQLAEWATLIWQIKPTRSGNWQQRWRWSSHYILLWRNKAGVAQL
jgi:hypothetical protein